MVMHLELDIVIACCLCLSKAKEARTPRALVVQGDEEVPVEDRLILEAITRDQVGQTHVHRSGEDLQATDCAPSRAKVVSLSRASNLGLGHAFVQVL